MRKNLQTKILASVLALGAFSCALPGNALADDFNAPDDGTIVNDDYDYVYGNGTSITIEKGTITNVFGIGSDSEQNEATGGNVTIKDGTIGAVFGGTSIGSTAYSNTVNINGGEITTVYGAASEANAVYKNTVNINGGVTQLIAGGYSGTGDAYNNTINISANTDNGSAGAGYVFGGVSESGNVTNNIVNITSSPIPDNPDEVTEDGGYVVSAMVFGGFSANGDTNNNIINISGGYMQGVMGGASGLDIFGSGTEGSGGNANGNTINISNGAIIETVVGGGAENGTANGNILNISGGTISEMVVGGVSNNDDANGNILNISGGTISGNVGAGVSTNGDAKDNFINISGSANIENANLYGGDSETGIVSGNTLTLDAWSGEVNSVNAFESLNFNNIDWSRDKNEAVLVINNNDNQTSDLSNTSVGEISFTGGGHIRPGDKYTLIENKNNGGYIPDNLTSNYIAGAALEGTASAENDVNGNLVYKINSVRTSRQSDLVTQSRAVSAAFINQGTDLISDTLDTLSRDDNYGVKTFAAMHGNRSKYDVNNDLKINGWSTIVGVGNATEFTGGDEFSWGIFYENGSGNYRTYNEFNNEFFRGDGSLVYNGGGIAARYENANGVYTEGSLRAGMLKNDMDNVLQNTNHVGHGYETESAYYGAHIGVGKIISLSKSSDLDVYGKFFHTYTEGDSFTVANDKFELDSITSDRLRLGARVTTNKENAFSTYYGLAYEYEFNGDADMRAQGVAAPQESLQGSSCMAELGFNYQPTPDSPWSFDLNLRGYAGEREGGSFNVQATYTF